MPARRPAQYVHMCPIPSTCLSRSLWRDIRVIWGTQGAFLVSAVNGAVKTVTKSGMDAAFWDAHRAGLLVHQVGEIHRGSHEPNRLEAARTQNLLAWTSPQRLHDCARRVAW